MSTNVESKVSGKDKLTPMQELFCHHYVITNSGVESAKLAGYKGTGISVSASRLLSMDKIKAKINELRQEKLKELDFDKTDTITWIIEMANPVNEYKYNPNIRLKAIELLGKAQGLFIDRKEVTQETNVNVHNPSNLSDEELDKLLGKYEALEHDMDDE